MEALLGKRSPAQVNFLGYVSEMACDHREIAAEPGRAEDEDGDREDY